MRTIDDFDRLKAVFIGFLDEYIAFNDLPTETQDSLLWSMFKAFDHGVDIERTKREANDYVH